MATTLAQILGHERQLALLRRLIKEGTVAGTYLFCGPENVGKTSVAVGLAKALLCDTKKGEGCLECKSCREVDGRMHPDYCVLEPEGASHSIRLERIEELRRRFQLASFHGGWKVGIIADAHHLYHQAAPALLKILEEPPPRAVFILISSKEEQVLPTLRSRCKLLPFFPVAEEVLAGQLSRMDIPSKEGRQALLRLAGGRPGILWRIAGEDFIAKRDKVLGLLEGLVFGRVDSTLRTVDGILELAKAKVPPSEEKDARNSQTTGQRAQERDVLGLLTTLLRDIWILQEGNDALVLHADQIGRLKKIAQSWQGIRIVVVLATLESATRDLELNVPFRLILERILFGAPSRVAVTA